MGLLGLIRLSFSPSQPLEMGGVAGGGGWLDRGWLGDASGGQMARHSPTTGPSPNHIQTSILVVGV